MLRMPRGYRDISLSRFRVLVHHEIRLRVLTEIGVAAEMVYLGRGRGGRVVESPIGHLSGTVRTREGTGERYWLVELYIVEDFKYPPGLLEALARGLAEHCRWTLPLALVFDRDEGMYVAEVGEIRLTPEELPPHF
jgi:hypothetical protein